MQYNRDLVYRLGMKRSMNIKNTCVLFGESGRCRGEIYFIYAICSCEHQPKLATNIWDACVKTFKTYKDPL